MKIAVIGTGYVGLVAGTCFAESGHDVTCIDVDPKKIQALRRGRIPIYEPGLEELVHRNITARRLHFTEDLKAAVGSAQVVFIAVGTPEGETGCADLQYVLNAAEQIGRALCHYTVIVDSTRRPATTRRRAPRGSSW